MNKYRYDKSAINFRHIQQYLSELLYVMAEQKNLQNVSYLTKDIHVWPDFHGNRSPLADPSLKGMVLTYTLHFFIELCTSRKWIQFCTHIYLYLLLDIWIILICRSGEFGVIILSSSTSTNGTSQIKNNSNLLKIVIIYLNHKISSLFLL